MLPHFIGRQGRQRMARRERSARSLLRLLSSGTYTGVDSPRLANPRMGVPTGVGARTAQCGLVPTGAGARPSHRVLVCGGRLNTLLLGSEKRGGLETIFGG